MKTWWHLKIAEAIGMIAVASLALGFVVMALWNALVPDLLKGSHSLFGKRWDFFCSLTSCFVGGDPGDISMDGGMIGGVNGLKRDWPQ